MSNFSVNIDQISFVIGGYGALGVGLYTGNLYRDVPDLFINRGHTNSEETCWVNGVKNYSNSFARFCLVNLKAAERFFVGGCFYSVIIKYLKNRSDMLLLNAIIAGGIVGAAETGFNERWKTILKHGGTVAGFSGGIEALILLLQKLEIVKYRPTLNIFFGNLDPLVFIIGATSSYAIGLYTLSFLNDIQIPHLPDDVGSDYMELCGFIGKCILNGISLEIKAEERTFFGGCLAWGVQALLQKVGIRNSLITMSTAGLCVGGYCSLYGNVKKKDAMLCTGGTVLCGLLAELFVAPHISRDYLWQQILPNKLLHIE